ncbi:hypothetical protein [Propionispora hippei]|uniref:Uncharacterized protein n=1 Tax=Propionispora hippei DSM 15287 TaxID=1123003 RepID=A0A1M6DZ20_9FIRM|nr:hypothetical protein [Propionispora hippei]SHI78399.1 hypothetical protein SAMN02745170_01059 [Propionispora hippei DSM 15287]
MYLSVEEYLAKRKNKDAVNEFDLDQRVRNMGLCISYVIDYFEKYLDPQKLDEDKADRWKKAEKLKKQFAVYDRDTAEWLLSSYMKHGKQLDLSVKNHLKTDLTYLLRYKPDDFGPFADGYLHSYQSTLPWIQQHKEQILQLMVSIAKRKNTNSNYTFGEHPQLGRVMIEWIKDTFNNYSVHLMKFAEDYTNAWFDQHCAFEYNRQYDRVDLVRDYDCKSSDHDLFEINALYERVKDLPFLINRKLELEILLMYTWLWQVSGDKKYWPVYLSLNEKRHQTVNPAGTRHLVLVQYADNPFPQEAPSHVRLAEAHFDTEAIKETGRYILNTENGYGKRTFSSPSLKACSPVLQNHHNGIPLLWLNREWAITFADLIKKQTQSSAEPELIEIYPPLKNTVSDLEKFLELYQPFEYEIRSRFTHTDIAVVNRCGTLRRGPDFLITSVDDMDKVCGLIAKHNLQLKISIDFAQLFKLDRSFKTDKMPRLLGQIKEFQAYVKCIHILGKMKSDSKRNGDSGNFLSYFNNNKDQKEAFLDALLYIFDDATVRYVVPEISGNLHNTISVLEDLRTAGFILE